MAKGNMFLGMARGKVGDVVMYRQNGQQMARVRTRVVKNPKTSGQQIQRMIQATAAYAYAGLKTIVDHSFEGIQYGGKSMNYFMKRNMDMLRAQAISAGAGQNITARFAAPNIRVLYPNKYVVSNGSLAPFAEPNSLIVSASGVESVAFDTFSNNYTDLASWMEGLGVSAGDQLTFLVLNVDENKKDSVAKIGDENARAAALAIRRIKFKDSYTEDELRTSFDAISVDEDDNILDASVSSADIILSRVTVNGKTMLAVQIPSFEGSRSIIGACCIKSRKVGETWLRSPQTMWIYENAFSEFALGFTITTAYNAWTTGVTSVGVSEYILNGKPNTDVWPVIEEESDDSGSDDDNP